MLVLFRRITYRSPEGGARAAATVKDIADFADRGVDVSSKTDECVAEHAIGSRYGLLVAATAVVEIRRRAEHSNCCDMRLGAL